MMKAPVHQHNLNYKGNLKNIRIQIPQNVVTSENFQAYRLTEAYRKHGHKKATGVPEIDLSNYGLSKDATTQFDTEEREWFAHTFESQRKSLIPDERKADLAKLMLKCQAFDHFLANKFTTFPR
ncbi:hypothetical protein AM593_02866, partial [Mytilus galloprovincialis]